MRFRSYLTLVVLLTIGLPTLFAAEPTQTPAEGEQVLAGHSYHGEAFNEGPRQAAQRIPGMAEIDFPTSTKSPAAQQFVEQGISQLHGFWYLEAERSFRQAAKEDSDLAIAYWGLAMANANNPERARGFIDEAMKRRRSDTTRRERLYIEALDRFIPKTDDKTDESKEKSESTEKEKQAAQREAKKKRCERYIADLERILHEFPDDIEAKAFLALQMWTSDRAGVKITSRYAVSALIGEVFAENPMHPAHHYRIHLWDYAQPKNALESAALCGPSSPGIAHMWHMPGHIYSKLKRYSDAAWQQEASARVDHSHMIRTRLMPDEIHNFAHNNEWLVRNLLYVGRVQDALDLSRNLVSLPRHPRYNTLRKRGSYKYGRQRLLQTLSEYGLWNELIDEAGGHYLPPTQDKLQQEEWLGWLTVAHFMLGDQQEGARSLRSLRRRRLALRSQHLDLLDSVAAGDDVAQSDSAQDDADSSEPEKPTAEELKDHIEKLKPIIARGAAAAATKRKDLDALKRNMDTAKLNSLIRAQWLAEAGDMKGGIELAEKAVRSGKQQVRPLAVLVDLLWRDDQKDKAKKHFETLRKVAGKADLDTPMLAKLSAVAEAMEIDGDWRLPDEPASDLGERPPLDDLGPFRWQPYTAPSWSAQAADGTLVSGAEFDGRPRVMIFYLGFGCLHCVEQLHEFAPMIDDFREAGIELVGVSTETVEQLEMGIKNFEEQMDIPLLSDEEHHVFDAFRCWDDFEDQALHGTFLIDARGRVRWQDISYEPFMDGKFLLEESKRLLALP